MDEIVETVTESIIGSGDLPPREYTEEEMQQQTTDFLLHVVNSMKELTEEQKARMRSSIIEKAFNPQALMEEISPPTRVIEPTSPQDLVVLLALICFIVGILGFFGYKLYKSIMDQELKKERKSKKELKKEKKTQSPPASPRTKKEL